MSLIDCIENCQFQKAEKYLTKEKINFPFFSGGRNVLYKSIMMDAPLEFIKKILDLGADVNFIPIQRFEEITHYSLSTPLKIALEMKRTDIAHILLDYGAKITDTNCSESIYNNLMQSANEENKLFEKFIEKGLQYNFINKDGNSLLHYAVKNCNIYIIKKLLSLNVDINLYNKLNYTPIEELCKNKFIDENCINTLNLLLSIPNINLKNSENEHVIFDAMKNNSFSHIYFNHKNPKLWQKTNILETFLNNKIDINITDNNNKNLLNWAIWNKQPDNIKLLISSGINIHHKDNLGKSCLEYAQELFPESLELFKDPNNTNTLQKCYENLKLETKIFKAYLNNDTDKIEECFKNGFNPNQHTVLFDHKRILEYTILRYHYAEINIIKTFLKNNANPELIPYSYNKKEEHSIIENLLNNFLPDLHMNLIYFLLKKCKNKNITDKDGNNIIMRIIIDGKNINDKEMETILNQFISSYKFNYETINENEQSFFDLIEENFPNLILKYQKLNPNKTPALTRNLSL